MLKSCLKLQYRNNQQCMKQTYEQWKRKEKKRFGDNEYRDSGRDGHEKITYTYSVDV